MEVLRGVAFNRREKPCFDDGALMVGYVGFKAQTNHDLLPIWQSMSSLSFWLPFHFQRRIFRAQELSHLSIACWGRHSDCGRSQRRRYLRCGLYNPKFERDLILWRLLWIAVGFQVAGAYAQSLRLATTGDINGDGKPDLIAAWGSGPTALLFIYLNKGDGTFSAPTTTTITTDTNLWPVPMSVLVGTSTVTARRTLLRRRATEVFSFFATGMAMELLLRPKTFTGRFLNSYQVMDAVE